MPPSPSSSLGAELMRLALLLALWSWGPVARAEPLPADLRAGFVLRTLSYDRRLEARAGQDLGLLVLSKPDTPDGEIMYANLAQAVDRITVSGLKLRLVRAHWSSPQVLEQLVQAQRISAIYLAAGLESQAATVARVAEATQATLIAADGADLPNGCALGFHMVDGRPEIVLDTERATAGGMEPDAALLRSSRVVH
jgi:hypothetical protein